MDSNFKISFIHHQVFGHPVSGRRPLTKQLRHCSIMMLPKIRLHSHFDWINNVWTDRYRVSPVEVELIIRLEIGNSANLE